MMGRTVAKHTERVEHPTLALQVLQLSSLA